jgi:hypothetical protein
MTEERPTSPPQTVTVDDVRRLFAAEVDDPVLVLRAGRAEVIDAGEQQSDEYRGSLFIASRRVLLEQTGAPADSEPELRRLAATLSEMADRLGG